MSHIAKWKDYDAWVAQAELRNQELIAEQEDNEFKMKLILKTVDKLKESNATDEEVLECIGNLIDQD